VVSIRPTYICFAPTFFSNMVYFIFALHMEWQTSL